MSAMRITAISGGVGGARFLRGLLEYLATHPDPDLRAADLTIIGNTGDDITLFGLKVCPDLDTVMYTLGGGIEESQGWGRAKESFTVQSELAAYGAQPQWFALGDRDFGTHIVRSELLAAGHSLSQATAILSERWGFPAKRVQLIPMTDDPVETRVFIAENESIHFQHWWVGQQAAVPAHRFEARGAAESTPAPGVLAAILTADVIVLPPSNPVVSIGIVLEVPGVRAALQSTTAPVVGVSPIVGGRPVRGHADACLTAIGLPTSADAVAGLYADFLAGWLVSVDDPPATWPVGLRVQRAPLLMTDEGAAADLAGAALQLGLDLR